MPLSGFVRCSESGGQAITADAPLERIPLHLRGGAKLPVRAKTYDGGLLP